MPRYRQTTGRHYVRGDLYREGDIVELTESQYEAFADKFAPVASDADADTDADADADANADVDAADADADDADASDSDEAAATEPASSNADADAEDGDSDADADADAPVEAFYADYDHWREAKSAILDGVADDFLDALEAAEEDRDAGARESILTAIDSRRDDR